MNLVPWNAYEVVETLTTSIFLLEVTMSGILSFDSSELLHQSDVASLSLEGQLAEIFKRTRLALDEHGLTMRNIFFIIAEVCDMKDRPILNEAQKAIWEPQAYPARIIHQRQDFKGGARIRLLFSASKTPHVCVNSQEGQIPTGPFSRAAIVGRRVYGSGVRPINPKTQTLISDDLREQAVQCLKNLDTNMRASGTSIQRAYAFTTYLTDMRNAQVALEVFEQFGFLPDHVQMSFELVQALNEGHPIEIACNALLP